MEEAKKKRYMAVTPAPFYRLPYRKKRLRNNCNQPCCMHTVVACMQDSCKCCEGYCFAYIEVPQGLPIGEYNKAVTKLVTK
jgi:hypothetical protein